MRQSACSVRACSTLQIETPRAHSCAALALPCTCPEDLSSLGMSDACTGKLCQRTASAILKLDQAQWRRERHRNPPIPECRSQFDNKLWLAKSAQYRRSINAVPEPSHSWSCRLRKCHGDIWFAPHGANAANSQPVQDPVTNSFAPYVLRYILLRRSPFGYDSSISLCKLGQGDLVRVEGACDGHNAVRSQETSARVYSPK